MESELRRLWEEMLIVVEKQEKLNGKFLAFIIAEERKENKDGQKRDADSK